MIMINNFSRLHLIAKFQFFYISYIEKSEVFADIIIYVILRIMLDNGLYSIIRSYMMRH